MQLSMKPRMAKIDVLIHEKGYYIVLLKDIVTIKAKKKGKYLFHLNMSILGSNILDIIIWKWISFQF